jgi:hypothetical protein
VPRETFVHEAELRLDEGADDREPGAAVETVAGAYLDHTAP